jgi:hypothetical protein
MRRSLVFGLRARNVDVLTALEAEMINRADEDHLTTATASGPTFTPSLPSGQGIRSRRTLLKPIALCSLFPSLVPHPIQSLRGGPVRAVGSVVAALDLPAQPVERRKIAEQIYVVVSDVECIRDQLNALVDTGLISAARVDAFWQVDKPSPSLLVDLPIRD